MERRGLRNDTWCEQLSGAGYSRLYRRRQLRKPVGSKVELWQYRHKWSCHRKERHLGNQLDWTKKPLMASDFKEKYKKDKNRIFDLLNMVIWVLAYIDNIRTLSIMNTNSLRFPVQFLCAFASTRWYLQLSSEDCPWTTGHAYTHTHTRTHSQAESQRDLAVYAPHTLTFYPSPCPVAPNQWLTGTGLWKPSSLASAGDKHCKVRLRLGLCLNYVLAWFLSLCCLSSSPPSLDLPGFTSLRNPLHIHSCLRVWFWENLS